MQARPALRKGNEPTIYELSADEQAAEIARWRVAVARSEKRIAAIKREPSPYGESATNASLASTYRELAHQLQKLSDAQHGTHVDEHAARRNVERNERDWS